MEKRRLLAIIEYDGTDFEGFQIQRGKRTIQGALEQALHQITGEKVRVVGAGRTDTGVHATGQGVHFDTAWKQSNQVLHRALNAILPTDLAVRSLVQVPRDFSARFSAMRRVYRYTIWNHPIRSPLMARYAWWVADPLDAEAMNAAAHQLIGKKDFGAFGTPPRGDNTVRQVYRASVVRDGERVIIEIEANAFLYRMVRRVVGTLVMVGKGTLSIEEFAQVIEKQRRAGEAVPPYGLCLTQVKYSV